MLRQSSIFGNTILKLPGHRSRTAITRVCYLHLAGKSMARIVFRAIKATVVKWRPFMATCKNCGGVGSSKCPQCRGRGRIVPTFGPSHSCKHCEGSGVVKCGVCRGTGSV